MNRPTVPRLSKRQDPIVARFREVARGSVRDDAVLLDGPHLLLDALRADVAVEVVLATAAMIDDPADDTHELWTRVRASGATLHVATAGVINAASPVRAPSGLVAIARWSPVPLGAIWATSPALVIGLVDVQDPGNAGAVIRSADALGATGVVMIGATADPASAKALRGAMGSTFRIPVARADLADTIAAARSAGVSIAATTASASDTVDLRHAVLTRPLLVLFGNEGAGLERSVLDQADVRLGIAMRPRVNSLNVAVSSALVLYEAGRQRSAL